jgi:alkylhydroperoxidase family enzyme
MPSPHPPAPVTLPARVKHLIETLLESPGHLAREIRRAIHSRAAGRGDAEPGGIPEGLAGWTDTVARHAYRCTDEGVTALRRAGFTEDQVFEATLAAAVGAGVARLEETLRLLRRTL